MERDKEFETCRLRGANLLPHFQLGILRHLWKWCSIGAMSHWHGRACDSGSCPPSASLGQATERSRLSRLAHGGEMREQSRPLSLTDVEGCPGARMRVEIGVVADLSRHIGRDVQAPQVSFRRSRKRWREQGLPRCIPSLRRWRRSTGRSRGTERTHELGSVDAHELPCAQPEPGVAREAEVDGPRDAESPVGMTRPAVLLGDLLQPLGLG